MTTAAEDRRRRAVALSTEGRHEEAAALLGPVVAAPEAEPADVLILGLVLSNAGKVREAAQALYRGTQRFPGEAVLHENLGVLLIGLGGFAEAVHAFGRAVERGGDNANVRDGLCTCFAQLGDAEAARRQGVASLEAKDRQALAAGPVFPLPAGAPAPFDPTEPQRNVIAFSLWGAKELYCEGALRNARLIPELYPGWTARFYCDETVPAAVREGLAAAGAEVLLRPRPQRIFDGLLWRFEPVGDPAVARFLVRDADSLVSVQERVAVDAWLASGRHFHVMRDWLTHTDLILAGLWGGVGGILPPVERLVADFRPFRGANLHFDQDLLRIMAWPTVRQSVLIHDSYFPCLGSEPFPALGRLPAGWRVGQTWTGRKLKAPEAVDRRR
ncbi:hypothetical protein SAMN06265365_1634 [Tistlia consotensis]|uniref:Uncharacterized protein n=1 Tax=Tistlia consotensis USBA 355 TaxID=560819 RepID=A0A1Y6CSB1_9PROT|nr:hypothetical protein [Tistlia consotensis]SMF85287.1 hypothetical protein SAMN05428998_1612 [Tistlia consotensis USBA 355]SNS39317.1 hypothetical protein SAMN06265365_1634 [Tistlia consotensis]